MISNKKLRIFEYIYVSRVIRVTGAAGLFLFCPIMNDIVVRYRITAVFIIFRSCLHCLYLNYDHLGSSTNEKDAIKFYYKVVFICSFARKYIMQADVLHNRLHTL